MIRTAAILLLAFAAISCQRAADATAEQSQRAVVAIPTAFQGLWLADQKACNQSDWREGYWLTADTVRMSQGGAPLKVSSIQVLTPADIIVATDDSSAGWSFDGKFRFVLDRSGRFLSNVYDNRTASFDYYKCEQGKNA